MAKVWTKLARGGAPEQPAALQSLLAALPAGFGAGQRIGLKVHWGERGNRSYLPPTHAAALVRWLQEKGAEPFVWDTTVLYSGGRRDGAAALETAAQHGYHAAGLGCPVLVGDGLDGRAVVDLPAGYKHFATVQVARVVDEADGFLVFSHFKGHMLAGFGGALKNLSMGFGSRAQKQRMHSDARPSLLRGRCTRCGVCVEVCPTGAAQLPLGGDPEYSMELCIGCAQCIGQCPEVALKIHWGTRPEDFQERVIETAAAVWQRLKGRSLFINALVQVSHECDCMPGPNPSIAPDWGFAAAADPVALDAACVALIGPGVFDGAHPGAPWRRQFDYAEAIGFGDAAWERVDLDATGGEP